MRGLKLTLIRTIRPHLCQPGWKMISETTSEAMRMRVDAKRIDERSIDAPPARRFAERNFYDARLFRAAQSNARAVPRLGISILNARVTRFPTSIARVPLTA